MKLSVSNCKDLSLGIDNSNDILMTEIEKSGLVKDLQTLAEIYSKDENV